METKYSVDEVEELCREFGVIYIYYPHLHEFQIVAEDDIYCVNVNTVVT